MSTFLGRLFGDSGRLYGETPRSETNPKYRPRHAARPSTPAQHTPVGGSTRRRAQEVRDSQ